MTFNISNTYFRIEEFINGERQVLEEVKHNILLSKNNLNIEFRVDGNELKGVIYGKVVIFTYSKNQIGKTGGIGFKIWDPKIGNSKMNVKSILVENSNLLP